MKVWSILLFVFVCMCCVSCGGDGGEADKIAKLTGDVAKGKTLWDSKCASCHGGDGKGVTGVGPDISKAHDADAAVIKTILNGDGTMPAFKTLANQEVADILAHLRKTIQGK